jgi:hypothetical protein
MDARPSSPSNYHELVLFFLFRIFDISLSQALPSSSSDIDAYGIEICSCPPYYTGLSCQVTFSFISDVVLVICLDLGRRKR